MILDQWKSEGMDVTISYLPVWELCYSMHVLSEPDHHLYRRKWSKRVEEEFPDLVKRIRDYSEVTCQWTLFIDVPVWSEMRQMEIPEFFAFLRKKEIFWWNQAAETLGKKLTILERRDILGIFQDYYEQIFRREERILRAYLVRVLEREREFCIEHGVWEWCKTIHERMRVEETQVRYLKNRDFVYQKKDIRRIYLTASTFLEPHLWLYQHDTELEVVESIRVEQPEDYHLPEQTVLVFKALGDRSRLNIVRLLFRGVKTTQELAAKLGLSEAAVSKHLKILSEAKLVKKKASGHYMEYTLNTEVVDFIPYTFYEMLTRF